MIALPVDPCASKKERLYSFVISTIASDRLGEPSPLEAAFSRAPVPQPSFGNTALWCPGKDEVSRVLWHSSHCRTPTAGASSKSTAASTWLPTAVADQSCHLEQWIHLQYARPEESRKRPTFAKEASTRCTHRPCADVSRDGFARRAFPPGDAREACSFNSC